MILLLAYFPTLYEDELLYSGIARYHMNSGNRTQKQTIEDLFGDRLVCSSTDLPSHLEVLAAKIINQYSSEHLIQNHTLFPYYSRFISQNKIEQVIMMMKKGAAQGEVHASLGLLATNVKAPKYLKYCRECYKTELKVCEPYWHRSHQLPGVSVCPYHKHPLTVSNVDYATQNHKFEFVALSKIGNKHFPEVYFDKRWSDKLEYIADQSVSMLLSSRLSMKAIPSYKNALYEQGYMTAGNRIRFGQLIKKFREFYSDELLQYLNCEVNDVAETWLHKIVRNHTEITHPLRHLLVLRFLGINADSLLTNPSSFPFGTGPWPCLNKAAEHYYHDVIKECITSCCSKTGLPVGTFKCSCGFVYSRRGPDQTNEDRYRKGRIKAFGQVWYGKLKELNETNMSLRKKADLLGVDPGTIKNQTEVLQSKQVPRSHMFNKEQFRLGNGTSVSDAKHRTLSTRATRVDWKKRDELLLASVMKAVNVITNLPEPRRISLASIKRFTAAENLSGKLASNLHKLPKTKSYIEKCIDTTESYQIRRIIWAANKLKETEGRVLGWRLLKTAGLNHPLRESVYRKFIEITGQV